MNKKKAIKIATASAIAASGFVAVAPAQAAVKTTNVNTVVNTAISKMAAAYDGYHKPGLQGKIPPTAKIRQLTTNAEAAYDAAIAAIAKDGGTKSQKAAFTKKLNAKKYLLTRAQGYVKAIDVNLNAAKKALDKAVASGKAKDVKAAEAALVKTAATFEKAVKAVYGPSTRKVLVAKYHVPALAKAATVKDELTVYNAYKEIENGNLTVTNRERALSIIEATEATVQKLATGDKRDTKLVKNLLDAVAKNKAKVGITDEVSSITAINATTVEVKYKKAVENVDASKYSIEGLTIASAVVKQTDSKTVVLTTSTQEGAKEYTVKSGAIKVGTFKGVSAVIPTAITVTTPSIQATVGKEVTVKATVTVPEGQSKAGIPVTVNIPASASGLNAAITDEVYTNANGEATYSYTRFSSVTEQVTVYPTGNRIVSSVATVYFNKALTVSEVTAGNSLANNAKKVYKVTGEANTVYNVAFKENLNTTSDKLVTVKVIDVNGDNNNSFPYQLSNNSDARQVTFRTDASGVGTFTLTGSNESVTPIVFQDEGRLTATNNNRFDANELNAQAPTLTFADVAYYNLTVKAEGSNNAAYSPIKGEGGRDYTITLKDSAGNLAKKGEKVHILLDETKSSEDAYLLDASKNKVYPGDGSLRSNIVDAEVNDKGEATFTVYGGSTTSYATPVVFIDRNNNGTLQSSDLKVTGDITYFAAAKTSSVGVKFFDENNKVVTSLQASKAARAEITVLDQNGKINKVATSARFEVTNPTASNLTVNINSATSVDGNAVSETFAQGTKTYQVKVVDGKASISLNAAGPLTAKVYASSGTFTDTQSITFTANPTTVIRGVVNAVDPTEGSENITLKDGTKIDLAGLTLRASGSDANYSVANFLKYVVTVGEIAEYNPTNKTLIVQDKDATGSGEIQENEDQAIVDAAKTALVAPSYNGIAGTVALPLTSSNGAKITWVEKTDAANVATLAADGTVTIVRSAVDDTDDNVTFTATIKKGSKSETKDISIIVKEAKSPIAVLPAAGLTNNTTTLVVTFDEALYNGTTVIPTGNVKSLFTYDGTPGNYTSATYNATSKTVTFVFSAAENGKKLTPLAALKDDAGNAVTGAYTYTATGTVWSN